MTLPVWRTVIIPSFTSIALTLREEFANRQKRLYENIYIDSVSIPSNSMADCVRVVLTPSQIISSRVTCSIPSCISCSACFGVSVYSVWSGADVPTFQNCVSPVYGSVVVTFVTSVVNALPSVAVLSSLSWIFTFLAVPYAAL